MTIKILFWEVQIVGELAELPTAKRNCEILANKKDVKVEVILQREICRKLKKKAKENNKAKGSYGYPFHILLFRCGIFRILQKF